MASAAHREADETRGQLHPEHRRGDGGKGGDGQDPTIPNRQAAGSQPDNRCHLANSGGANDQRRRSTYGHAVYNEWRDASRYQERTIQGTATSNRHPLAPVLLDVFVQAGEGSKDLMVIGVVGPQLHAVGLRHRKGDFQHVD